MLDIKEIRKDPERIKLAMRNRNMDLDAKIDEILKIDEDRRAITQKVESMKAEQNQVTKKIPAMKKANEDTTEIMAKMKKLSDEIAKENANLSSLESKQRDIILSIPNCPNKDVPIGKDDSENVEIRRWGEARKFDFTPKAHWDLGKDLGILDPERAAKVTGKRFHFYKDLGARLERSIINFYLNTHTQNGYTEVFPPFMANRDSMTATGQLPKFEEDAFHLDGQDYFLIPTAEVPVTNLYRNEILKG